MKTKLIKALLSAVFLLTVSLCLFSCGEDEIKINFIVNGEVYHTVKAADKTDIEMPTAPVLDGHTFGGWYLDSTRWSVAFDESYLKNNELSADLFVYAKWITEHEHTPGEFTVLEPASCERDGMRIQKCTECEEIIITEKIEKLGHSEITVSGTAATDTVDGYTDGSFCTRCNSILTEQKLIPAKIFGTDIGSDFFTVSERLLSASVSDEVEEINIKDNVKIYSLASVVISYDMSSEEKILDTAKLSYGTNLFYATVTYEGVTSQYTVSVYRRPVYTVSFDTGCDEKIESQTVKHGSLVLPPKNISNGYSIFVGWYLNGVLWNFEENTPTSDITLVAKWEAKKIMVTFTANDTVYLVLEVEIGAAVEKPNDPEIPPKSSLEGWYIKGTDQKWNFNTPITEEITLEAKIIPVLPGDSL